MPSGSGGSRSDDRNGSAARRSGSDLPDLQLEDFGNDDDDDHVALSLQKLPVYDSNWFQAEWQKISSSQSLEADVIDHQYIDTAAIEALIERHQYTLVASGQPEPSLHKLYFFAHVADTKDATVSSVVLCELVVNTATNRLGATFKTTLRDPKVLKSFMASFRRAFSSILKPAAPSKGPF